MNGFVNVYKPSGMSSAFCVWLVKRAFGVPCGHMGTLDPMAAGVLPIGVGKASRLFNYLLGKEKVYIADFTFGYETDTLDATGVTVKDGGKTPDLDEINAVLNSFTGEISQVPPKFSAKCVNGKRGYQLARAGKDFELEAKKVYVDKITVEATDKKDTFRFTVVCKGGTYIRSLCRDIAAAVGTVATMTALERVRVGSFTKESSVNADDVKNLPVESLLIPSDTVVDFPKLYLNEEQAKRLINGLNDAYALDGGLYRVYNCTEFWGVGEISNGALKMKSYVRG